MRAITCVLLMASLAADGHEAPHAPAAAMKAVDAGSDYVIKLEQMTAIDAGEGERIHLLRGSEHGFKGLSFILTQTAPGGGPPLHTHDSEEAHVLTSGVMSYVIGDQSFVVSAPYILRVPANTAHTFVNAGSSPLSLTAVFDSADYTFKPIGPNPIQKPKETAP